MASPNHAWWDGMYLVGRNFYSRFVPEARAAAGAESMTIVDARLDAGSHHDWLNGTDRPNPILGYVPPPPAPDAAPAEAAAGGAGPAPAAGSGDLAGGQAPASSTAEAGDGD
jgi:hypothetical protein